MVIVRVSVDQEYNTDIEDVKRRQDILMLHLMDTTNTHQHLTAPENVVVLISP